MFCLLQQFPSSGCDVADDAIEHSLGIQRPMISRCCDRNFRGDVYRSGGAWRGVEGGRVEEKWAFGTSFDLELQQHRKRER